MRKQTHIVYGFVTALIMVVVSAAMYTTGLEFKYSWAKFLAEIPFLAGVIMNAVAYSKANDARVNFGNVFGSCIKMSMIVTLVILVWSIASTYIFPALKDQAMELARKKMAESPNVTDDQIEMSMNVMRKFWTPILVAGAIFGTMFYGAIFSLIGGAVAKKNGVQPLAS